jgi:hypothetical protein
MATMGNNNVIVGHGNPVVFFSPGHARELVEQGFPTKRAVREFLFERSRIPVERFPVREINPARPVRPRAGADGTVAPIEAPDDLLIVVAGGPEPYHITYCPSFGETAAVTRRIAG